MPEYNDIETKLELAFQKVFADAVICPNNNIGFNQAEAARPLIYTWCRTGQPLVPGAITGNYNCPVEIVAETMGLTDPSAESVAPAHRILTAALRDCATQNTIVALLNAAALALALELTIYEIVSAVPTEQTEGLLFKSSMTLEVIAANAAIAI